MTLRSFFVILPPPCFDDNLGVMKAVEPMLIQTFISKAPIVQFGVGVLVGFSRFDYKQCNAT